MHLKPQPGKTLWHVSLQTQEASKTSRPQETAVQLARCWPFQQPFNKTHF